MLIVALLPAAHCRAGVVTLVDFGDIRKDQDPMGREETIRAFDHAWGPFGDGVHDMPRKGILIDAPKNAGEIGEERSSVSFAGHSKLVLYYIVGERNEAKRIVFVLKDKKGNSAEWSVFLTAASKGKMLAQPILLAHPEKITGDSKFDLQKLRSWAITGDWTDSRVNVFLIRLCAMESGAQ